MSKFIITKTKVFQRPENQSLELGVTQSKEIRVQTGTTASLPLANGDTRIFWSIVGANVLAAVLVIILFLRGEYEIAAQILLGFGGATLGFQIGFGSGYAKAKRDKLPHRKGSKTRG